jgi:uncharacterized delta-60 repeat protein
MTLITRQGKGSKLTIQEMDGNLSYLRGSYHETLTPNIDWSKGQLQEFELSENATFSFSNAEPGQKLTLLINQLEDAQIGWPSAVVWPNGAGPIFKLKMIRDPQFITGLGFNDTVLSITLQPDGKILAGGLFTEYNGQPVGRIARLNEDGSLDTGFTTGSGFNSRVRTIVLQPDGKILVGGYFNAYNGQFITGFGLTRLNEDGSIDTGFITGSFSDEVYSIALQPNGGIIVGGRFTGFFGELVNRIVRLNPDGSLDTGFTTGSGFNNDVNSIAIQGDGKILVGGNFTQYDGQPVGRIARLNGDGSLDTLFDTGIGFNSVVQSIALQGDGKILVVGNFTQYSGQSVSRIARLNEDGSLDTGFSTGTGFNQPVLSIAIQGDGKILAGGFFTQYNGQPAGQIARLNEDGSLDTSFDTGSGFNGSVRSIALQGDGKILVGGQFNGYDGLFAGRIVRLTRGPRYWIQEFYYTEKGVYIGGPFIPPSPPPPPIEEPEELEELEEPEVPTGTPV